MRMFSKSSQDRPAIGVSSDYTLLFSVHRLLSVVNKERPQRRSFLLSRNALSPPRTETIRPAKGAEEVRAKSKTVRILSLDAEPFHHIPYLMVVDRGQQRRTTLPVYRGRVDSLPEALQAVVCTSDLQGRESVGGRLLGHTVAEELCRALPAPEKIGVVLAGDLYVPPELDERGGFGDVVEVWRAFQERFRWVTGVLGNHDDWLSPDISYLDGKTVEFDGLQIAGLSGITGRPGKVRRRQASDYCRELRRLFQSQPDLVAIHPSPELPKLALTGSPEINKALQKVPESLLVCGHRHWRWSSPLPPTLGRLQLLNVEARVVVLSAQ